VFFVSRGDCLLAYILAFVVLVVAALLAFGLAALLHLQGVAYLVFVILVLVLGIAAAVVILVLHYRAKKEKEQQGELPGTAATAELDLLLNDANRKLRTSQQGAKTLESLPLVYILGDSGTAKTTTVIRSGLDPELLAGTAPQEGQQVQTDVLNLWFTKIAALLEVGAVVRQNNTLLARLVHRTRARAYRSAFGTGAAPRAVVVCVSTEQLLVGDGGQSLMASARTTGGQLREISRLLGMPVPVYVIVTKLDRIPHFENYIRNLSDAEVRQILGSPLPRSEASVGTYADQAARMLAGSIDGLIFKLGEFRVEMLDRENDPASIPGVYEFPRELGKVRKNLNQYLVELCKPSQLSANPYLRGFFFTGIRARVVERMANAPAAVEQRPMQQDAGATQYINLSMGRPGVRPAASTPVMSSSRVPQWTFLPRLFPEVILGDRSALSATTQSAPARLFRRILFGTLAFLLTLYLVFLIISFFNNLGIEHRIQKAAHAIPSVDATATSLPSLTDLKALDDLRQTIVQLDDYRKNGAPWSYRWGLYRGDKLDDQARTIYFDRFRPMLLNPTQANWVAYMRTLPDAPATSSDFTSYIAAYNPLKAYLITTSNPDKSQPKFLTPVFYQYWAGTRAVEPEQQGLANKQIDFYGNELLRHPPYDVTPDALVVEHTRAFLSKFLAETRIYQQMLTDADKNSQTIDFNRQYPGSATYVVDSHIVRGAFTKTGFGFMQDALQHPEKYAQGETWVLGNQATSSLNTSAIGRDLTAQYTADFLKEWRAFLASAKVGCGTLQETPDRLNALAGPASPLLALFYTVSHNTAVSDPQIKSVFQPTQVLVDPNATDRLIGPGSTPYVTALSNLAGAIQLAAQNPAPPDQASFAPISQQVIMANGSVTQAAQGFNVDAQMHTEAVVVALMRAPIDCVSKLAPSPGGPANGAGAKICDAISPLLRKYPFLNNSNAQASLPEVDAAFAPETGALWSAFNSPPLKAALIQQGGQYIAAPTAPGPVNPRFVAYFNRAAHVSTTLYPPGQKAASFTFNARFVPGGGVSSATFVVDGQRMAAGNSQQFTWNAAGAQSASLIYDGTPALPFQGTWSVFELVRTAQVTKTAGGYRLDYIINTATTIQGRNTGPGGATKTATFELSGPGADLLVGDGFIGLTCASPVILPAASR
jgi:type VI secretion system protein ImpL